MQIDVTDGRLHRIERVQKAIRLAGIAAGLTEPQLDHLIHRIVEDHGRLTVWWHFSPSEQQRLAWANAWVACRETADRVFHEVAP
jgi:hypothetical protein